MLGKKTLYYGKVWNDFLGEFPKWFWWAAGALLILGVIFVKATKG